MHDLSRRTPSERYIVFSSYKSNVSSILNDAEISYKTLFGCYAGLEEISFICNARDYSAIVDLGLFDDQESILHLGEVEPKLGVRSAELHTLTNGHWDGGVTKLGYLWQASEELARAQDAWSFDPETNNWFVCAKRREDIK